MYLYKKIKTSLISLSVIFASLSSMAMQLPLADRPVKTINLQAEIDVNSQKALYQTVGTGLAQAQARVQRSGMQCHFHVNDLSTPSKAYHISVGTFEAFNANDPLLKSDSNIIWNACKEILNGHKEVYNLYGHIYGIHLYVHGFDANGDSINKHYPCVAVAKENLRNDFNINQGVKLTHFHIVGRYGTSFRGGPKGQFAMDCEQLISSIATPGSKYANANRHHGNDFLGHVTLAVAKRQPGLVTAQSQQFETEYFDEIIGVYEDIAEDYHQNTRRQNRQLPIAISKFKTNSR